ncbi:hypothetical protein ACRS85_04645 [Pluralibacter gergoviae]|uniref:hypothetical protein n=1 Tax=Pluralibacter gergoviae TaxID=61647 RepID=UPI003EE38605
MRELSNSELNEVSGAGFIADAGTALGRGIGAIIEAAGGKGGLEAALLWGPVLARWLRPVWAFSLPSLAACLAAFLAGNNR